MRFRRSLFVLVLSLAACQPVLAPAVIRLSTDTPQLSPAASLTSQPTFSPTPTETALPSQAPEPSPTLTPSQTLMPADLGLDPVDWKNWPVLPIITERARQIYQLGQSLGNDPHAFSVFGDCQSEPEIFLGPYDTDPGLAARLPSDLRETVAWFAGSFNRLSPTVKGGTTTGALLWYAWHQNKYTCTIYESPLECELRLHKPAFVILRVGTHYESRNEVYMRKVLDQLIAAGVLPILSTKADDRELDEHVNTGYAQLAAEYNLPFWNLWAAVAELPKGGLYTRPDRPGQGDIYLTDEAIAIQRLSALQMLDSLRRAVLSP